MVTKLDKTFEPSKVTYYKLGNVNYDYLPSNCRIKYYTYDSDTNNITAVLKKNTYFVLSLLVVISLILLILIKLMCDINLYSISFTPPIVVYNEEYLGLYIKNNSEYDMIVQVLVDNTEITDKLIIKKGEQLSSVKYNYEFNVSDNLAVVRIEVLNKVSKHSKEYAVVINKENLVY